MGLGTEEALNRKLVIANQAKQAGLHLAHSFCMNCRQRLTLKCFSDLCSKVPKKKKFNFVAKIKMWTWES